MQSMKIDVIIEMFVGEPRIGKGCRKIQGQMYGKILTGNYDENRIVEIYGTAGKI